MPLLRDHFFFIRVVRDNVYNFNSNVQLSSKTVIDIPTALLLFGDPASYDKIESLVRKYNDRWNEKYPVLEAASQGEKKKRKIKPASRSEIDFEQYVEVLTHEKYIDPYTQLPFKTFVVLSINNYAWTKEIVNTKTNEDSPILYPCRPDDWSIELRIGSTSLKYPTSKEVTATNGEKFYFDSNRAFMNLKIIRAIFKSKEFGVYLDCVKSAFEETSDLHSSGCVSLSLAAEATAPQTSTSVEGDEEDDEEVEDEEDVEEEVQELEKESAPPLPPLPMLPPPPPPHPKPSSSLSSSSSSSSKGKSSKRASSTSSRQYQ